MSDAGRLIRVVLDGEALTRPSPLQDADRAQAVTDLEAENAFAPAGLTGPFTLHLSIQEGRLAFDIRDAQDAPLAAHLLALGPFRKLMKDYQMLVESHIQAVQEGTGRPYPGDRHGPPRAAQRGCGADDPAARGQDRDRFRNRPPAVHARLRAAPKARGNALGMRERA